MQLSDLSNRLSGQPMFNLLAKAKELEKQGKKIIHMEIGDSCQKPDQQIINALKDALYYGHTRYCSSMGLYEFREAICNYTEKDLGFRPDIDQVLVCPANAIIDFAIRCIMNEKAAIFYPNPGFPTYNSVIRYNNMNGYSYYPYNPNKIEEINQLLKIPDPKQYSPIKLIIVNSPGNPMGNILSKEEIFQFYEMAQESNLYILSDEVYSRIIYEKHHHSPTIYDQCKERTILLQSFSKLYAMSGFRLGYAIGPKELIKKMGLMLETIISCIPPFIQKTGQFILENQAYFDTVIDLQNRWLKEKRNYLVEGLNKIPGFECSLPQGAFYVWCSIENTGYDDLELADLILDKTGVACLPGRYFGSNGEGYLRFCFASVDLHYIKEALEKIRKTAIDNWVVPMLRKCYEKEMDDWRNRA